MLLYAIVLVVLEAVAEILLHHSAYHKNLYSLLCGVAVYVILSICFWAAMKHVNLTNLNAVWQCSNIVIVSLFGVLILKDKLNTANYVGLVLAFIACVLMSIT